MKTLLYLAVIVLVVAAAAAGWLTIRMGRHSQTSPSAQQSSSQPRVVNSQVASATPPAGESPKRLGPFLIAGQAYTIELQTKKLRPGSTADSGDTVVAMEIQDAAGTVQYRSTFPYAETSDDDLESWSVSAFLLAGTNGKGLLVNYHHYFEPSAPEEEPSGWFQVFGVLNGRLAPFGAPLQVQGGLLDEYVAGGTYRAARPLGAQADAVEFKVWAGHCRLVFPVRVDWTQG